MRQNEPGRANRASRANRAGSDAVAEFSATDRHAIPATGR